MSNALERLRGTLPASANTARDLAATTQTRCERRRALAVVGARVDAAAKLLGPIPPASQSPFALAVGNLFESTLRARRAARLREALSGALGMDPDNIDVEDFDALVPWDSGSREEVSKSRRARTLAALEKRPAIPLLLLHPRFELTITDSTRDLEPDALLLHGDEATLVEIKAFVDHGHRTDPHDLAATRMQLAVYALALEQVAGAARVRSEAVIVLRRPHTMYGSASLESIARDLVRLRRAFVRVPNTLLQMFGDAATDATLDDPKVLRALRTQYRPGYCLSACAMALQCRTHAGSHPDVLGSPVRELLAGFDDLHRVHDLVTSRAEPTTDREREFVGPARLVAARIADARKR